MTLNEIFIFSDNIETAFSKSISIPFTYIKLVNNQEFIYLINQIKEIINKEEHPENKSSLFRLISEIDLILKNSFIIRMTPLILLNSKKIIHIINQIKAIIQEEIQQINEPTHDAKEKLKC